MEPSNLYLTIRNRLKAIPYGSGDRPDGSRNHGYKRLKGNTELAATIPEAQDIEALRHALVRLNHSDTAFFTVGCERSFNEFKNGVTPCER